MPISEAIPLTFSERLFALVEGVSGERAMVALVSELIPIPEIGYHIVRA